MTVRYGVRSVMTPYHSPYAKGLAVTSDPPADPQTHHQIVTDVQRKTYTVDQAAELLGIGRNTAYEAVRRGEIPTIKIGRRLLVPRTALERMLSGEGTAA